MCHTQLLGADALLRRWWTGGTCLFNRHNGADRAEPIAAGWPGESQRTGQHC